MNKSFYEDLGIRIKNIKDKATKIFITKKH